MFHFRHFVSHGPLHLVVRRRRAGAVRMSGAKRRRMLRNYNRNETLFLPFNGHIQYLLVIPRRHTSSNSRRLGIAAHRER